MLLVTLQCVSFIMERIVEINLFISNLRRGYANRNIYRYVLSISKWSCYFNTVLKEDFRKTRSEGNYFYNNGSKGNGTGREYCLIR